MKAHVLLGFLAIVTLLACDGEAPRPPTRSQWDSAGVTIVESALPLWSGAEGWTVDSLPILDLATAGAGPSHEFFRVRAATRLSDGVVVVANGGSNEIRFFSPAGEFLHAVGGEGKGPGEFVGLWSIDRYRGDSLVAFDSRLRRITVLSPEGETSRISLLWDIPVRALEPMSDGGFISRFFWPSAELYEGESGVLVRQPDPIVRLSDSGQVVDTLVMSAGYEEFMDERGPAVPLFGKDSHFAMHGGRISLGDADRMEFKILSASGRLERIVRAPGMDFSISGRDLADERDGRLGPDPPPSRLEAFSKLPVPGTKPAYTKILVDSQGCIWAEEYRHAWLSLRSNRPRNWSVFGPQGEWLGVVRFPAPLEVFEIGEDYVLGLGRDDKEVEHVQLLRLNRN